MQACYNYTCPHCSQECSVEERYIGNDVQCPHCSQEFFTTPPDDSSQSPKIILPENIPFFKSGKRKLLEERMRQLVADGEMSNEDEDVLNRTAIMMGLDKAEVNQVVKKRFLAELEPLQQQIERAWTLTDADLEKIELLKKKYGIQNLTLAGNADLFRQVYLVEEHGHLPPPVYCDLFLDEREEAYFAISSTWHQTRVKNLGYAGAVVSIPTGMKGVRFRFGQYSPIRTQQITPLSAGVLYATTKRLLFQGQQRNTKIEYKRIIDTEICSDCLIVDKATGKPDYFSMNPAQARLATALIARFR